VFASRATARIWSTSPGLRLSESSDSRTSSPPSLRPPSADRPSVAVRKVKFSSCPELTMISKAASRRPMSSRSAARSSSVPAAARTTVSRAGIRRVTTGAASATGASTTSRSRPAVERSRSSDGRAGMTRLVVHRPSCGATPRVEESSDARTLDASPAPLTTTLLPTSASTLVGSSIVVAARPE
jgi:hypothetical protein